MSAFIELSDEEKEKRELLTLVEGLRLYSVTNPEEIAITTLKLELNRVKLDILSNKIQEAANRKRMELAIRKQEEGHLLLKTLGEAINALS